MYSSKFTDFTSEKSKSPLLYQSIHCVDLTQSTIEANKRFFASIDDVPKQAYTMGIGTIMKAKKILMIVSGADKAERLSSGGI